MGTTLTGTTPQDTYDSLIKVTDNGPLSGTLKALSDGLGNDSTLSLSTTAASIAGTLAVIGNATFDTSTLVVDAVNNRVGVGTATPLELLHLQATSPVIQFTKTGVLNWKLGNTTGNNFIVNTDSGGGDVLTLTTTGNVGIGSTAPNRKLVIQANGATANEQVLFLKQPDDFGFSLNLDAASTGNLMIKGVSSGTEGASIVTMRRDNLRVGINNDAPAVPLDVTGNIRSSTGILFGTDTAAANLLDDYEEGTWTMGVSFGGASVGVTTSLNTGTYTKIGRQVTVNGVLLLSSKGSSTGDAKITGLPFTIANSASNYSSPSLTFSAITFTNQFQGESEIGTTNILLQEITILGAASSLTNADFANNSYILLCLTYFV